MRLPAKARLRAVEMPCRGQNSGHIEVKIVVKSGQDNDRIVVKRLRAVEMPCRGQNSVAIAVKIAVKSRSNKVVKKWSK